MINTWSNEKKLKREINKTSQKRNVFVQINDVKIKLQLDTGSDIAIINKQTWRKMGEPSLLTSDKVAS